jgi:hypothetical protein
MIIVQLCASLFASADSWAQNEQHPAQQTVKGRRLQEEPTSCSADGFVAHSQVVMQNCCPAGVQECTKLPEHCDQPGCADAFVAFFTRCHAQLKAADNSADLLTEYETFYGKCHDFQAGVTWSHAILPWLPPVNGDGAQLCFDVTCKAPVWPQENGVVVESGCQARGVVGSLCRLGCQEGYKLTEGVDGHCVAKLEGSAVVSQYQGQEVTCQPEQNADGTMAESYCRLEEAESILNCCELATSRSPGVACSTDQPPADCSVGCAEVWLPLVENCEQYLANRQALTASCDATASTFLAEAPSSLTVSGLKCHPGANGDYSVAEHTVGGKPRWVRQAENGLTYTIYAINAPHDGWAIGADLKTEFALIESYEGLPPWGEHAWREVCERESEQMITLAPAYSDHDCMEALRLLTPDLTETCCEGDGCFEKHLASADGPLSCGVDCAHLFFTYSEECASFLAGSHPGLTGFSKQCAETHAAMMVRPPPL